MTQTTVPPLRGRVRVLALVVAGMATVGLAYACVESKRSNGEACLKSEDCLSALCQQLVCAEPGPLTDTMATNSEGGTTADTGPAGEASADTGSAADTGTAAESGSSSGGPEGGEAGEASSD